MLLPKLIFFFAFSRKQERRAEYFRWAKDVVDNLRGTNEGVEQALDKIFQKNIVP